MGREITIKVARNLIFTKGCLVQIFTTRGVLAPPANNLIMSGTSTRSFRHLEHQNLSIILGDIGRARSMQQFQNGTEERNGRTERSTVVLDDRIYEICSHQTWGLYDIKQ